MKRVGWECDRCETSTTSLDGWATMCPVQLHNVNLANLECQPPAYEMHLCPKCLTSLSRWLKAVAEARSIG